MQKSVSTNDIISLKNIGVCFKKRKSLFKAKKSESYWALKDISFSVKKGEILGVIGKNGAGKSTLLSLLAGIIAPDKGVIESMTDQISLLSLQAGFVPFLSGRKNIILAGMLQGLSKTEIHSKMQEIIEFSELENFIDEPVVNYSAGMKTRLGFSTAIAINPDVILIDEVLGVGDKSFKIKSEAALTKKLRGDTTAIIVSHSEATIKKLCDRVVFISDGKSQEFASAVDGLNEYNKSLKKK